MWNQLLYQPKKAQTQTYAEPGDKNFYSKPPVENPKLVDFPEPPKKDVIETPTSQKLPYVSPVHAEAEETKRALNVTKSSLDNLFDEKLETRTVKDLSEIRDYAEDEQPPVRDRMAARIIDSMSYLPRFGPEMYNVTMLFRLQKSNLENSVSVAIGEIQNDVAVYWARLDGNKRVEVGKAVAEWEKCVRSGRNSNTVLSWEWLLSIAHPIYEALGDPNTLIRRVNRPPSQLKV